MCSLEASQRRTMSQSPCRAPRFLRQILSSLVTTGFQSYMYSFLNFSHVQVIPVSWKLKIQTPLNTHGMIISGIRLWMWAQKPHPPPVSDRVELMGGSSMNQVKLILNH